MNRDLKILQPAEVKKLDYLEVLKINKIAKLDVALNNQLEVSNSPLLNFNLLPFQISFMVPLLFNVNFNFF